MSERLKNLLLCVGSALISYALAEAGYSYAYRWGYIDNIRDGWFFEQAGDTIHFDPEIGYRLTGTPSRNLRITKGQIEYEGVFRGNNQGFQDRDDFWPDRPATHPFRVAVLGDSFSSGQFLATNWPDQVETLAANGQASSRPLELLNFSLYSGGLVNWRNILLKRIAAEGYQLDLLVFPVYANDLFRPFMLFEARNTRKLLIGQAGRDPDHLPATLEEALTCCLSASEGYIVTTEEWHQLKETGWHPEIPRPAARYLAQHVSFVAQVLAFKFRESLSESAAEPGPGPAAVPVPAGTDYVPDPALGRGQFTPELLRLIADIRQYAHEQNVMVWVVRVPDREELIHQAPPAGNVLEFAELLGADFIDGAEAYQGMTVEQRRAQFFPFDGHWNQAGSDQFARFMLGRLRSGAASGAAKTVDPAKP